MGALVGHHGLLFGDGIITDPNFSSVVSLLPLNGSNGSTTITDITGLRTWAAAGAAAISTSQSRFGGACLALPGGAGDRIDTGDSVDFFFPGDFTIELSLRTTSLATRQFVCGQANIGATDLRSLLEITTGGAIKFWYDLTNTMTSATSTIATNTWYDVQIIRSGSAFTLGLNGSSVASLSYAGIATDFNSAFAIGRAGVFNSLYFSGFVDEFRVTRGVARTLAAKTAAFPTS